ncbi:hypothetical protein [uncultured Sulfitobacter sp.]|uniref:hypothetical protein n=1 Tax=uncultured Sulfitobacter sp. TaxID=191468 RepID=UPI0026192202|nr:hypothetical protein [uncultured Sulfitobacter sp.]
MRNLSEYVKVPDFFRNNTVNDIYYDIDATVFRIETAERLRQAFLCWQTKRLAFEDSREIDLDIQMAPPITGHICASELWEHLSAMQGTAAIDETVIKTESLRMAIIDKPLIWWPMNNADVSEATLRAVALMTISVNATGKPQETEKLSWMSELWLETQDPRGDAPQKCNDAFADDTHNENRAAGARNGEDHAQQNGHEKTSPSFSNLAQ